MVINLVHHPDRDPRIRALAELLHHIRPTWDRAGIRSALLTATLTKSFEQTTRAAVSAVFDSSAHTPATIFHRDGDSFSAKSSPEVARKVEPKPAYDRPRVDGQLASLAELPQPGDYSAGAAQARAHVRAAITAAKAEDFRYIGENEC